MFFLFGLEYVFLLLERKEKTDLLESLIDVVFGNIQLKHLYDKVMQSLTIRYLLQAEY